MEEREVKRNDGRDGMIEGIEGDKDEWGRQGEEEGGTEERVKRQEEGSAAVG